MGNTNRFSNKNIHNLLNINCCYPCHICKIANFNNSKPLSETSWAKIHLNIKTKNSKFKTQNSKLKTNLLHH